MELRNRILKTITGQTVEISTAEQIDNVLEAVEGIAEKLEGLRAALEDVSSDQGKADLIEGACRRAARQLLALAEQGGIPVEDL